MSTTFLIPLVGMLCMAVAALLLSPDPCRARVADRPEEAERLVPRDELDTIRMQFVRTHGVITAVRTVGERGADYREIELDLMVTRRGGGRFPARDTALIPADALEYLSPGSVVVAYYRSDDESSVAVCVPPC
ncbi:hypothetical protein A5757_15260 [Mycobacterium sp. 852013-51886_SCH5428379]|uniref:hypothetical protein n=1 Tax=Mycobacterium sp. 852013-51886_SCH5428379 TaxID=1834111 RepID=UPI0007FD6215|nr:hypothetical protein [Mycobacterium sp. 852013-51886_SCH5428379]OBB58988.1 hypothetical protein A5757_15260 [Mycobacterium sp. 852013-51886_SCH5428379]